MKKIIMLLLMPILAFSQIEKGRKMIGGDISFYSIYYSEGGSSSILVKGVFLF